MAPLASHPARAIQPRYSERNLGERRAVHSRNQPSLLAERQRHRVPAYRVERAAKGAAVERAQTPHARREGVLVKRPASALPQQ